MKEQNVMKSRKGEEKIRTIWKIEKNVQIMRNLVKLVVMVARTEANIDEMIEFQILLKIMQHYRYLLDIFAGKVKQRHYLIRMIRQLYNNFRIFRTWFVNYE